MPYDYDEMMNVGKRRWESNARIFCRNSIKKRRSIGFPRVNAQNEAF